jgi:hypothetical protein
MRVYFYTILGRHISIFIITVDLNWGIAWLGHQNSHPHTVSLVMLKQDNADETMIFTQKSSPFELH